MPPLTNSRRRAWRGVLSALAGGGLTAAGLSGPFSGGAIAADVPVGSPSPADGSAPSVAAPTPATNAPVTGAPGQPTNTSSTPTSTSTAPPASTPAPSGVTEGPPTVVLQRRQKTTASKQNASRNLTATHAQPKGAQRTTGGANAQPGGAASGPNNVAAPPQLIVSQGGMLAAELAGSAASAQALAFYRIPLFLLPIYQAAAVQYGVPWQILAAINEIETDYGSDQSVSTAGAVGWMQFMPATWVQYGVDALNAGYADPYNPVDAIFAAARYLRAAGAQSNLRTAILAYNHSDEYANSVLLRAKLISTYPKSVIATLTGLTDGRLPVTGKQVAWGALALAAPSSPSSATANATAVPGNTQAGSNGVQAGPNGVQAGSNGAAAQSAVSGAPANPSTPATPGSSVPLSPTAAAAVATGKGGASAQAPQLVDLMSAPNALVVAVQDGRILQLGSSSKLGKYVILRDVYGDVFTYAGLGSIAPSYRLPKAPPTAGASVKAPVAGAASTHDPAPSRPASAGRQLPLTLKVKKGTRQTAVSQDSVPAGSAESTPSGMGKVRLFAHPGNPDALAAAARGARGGPRTGAGHQLPLRRGSLVTKGTVLGHVRVPPGARDGHLRFAIRPVGDPSTIDPRPILANWKQLDTALHPQGAKGESNLIGATASEVFVLTKDQLEREVLSDPGIDMPACSRHEVASGAIDKRVLVLLAFLSRSGLKPTVGTLRCGGGAYAVSGYVPVGHIGDAVAIAQINGTPIAGNQGPGSVTDTTIRTLLTLQGEFVPNQIVSLMRYPGAPNTLARPDHGDYIEIDFSQALKHAPALKSTATTAVVAHSAGAGRPAPSPLVVIGDMSATQWNRLITHIATLPQPTVAAKPSSAAIRDHTKGS
jgi:membrane-bound lytic murein transglycosylase B